MLLKRQFEWKDIEEKMLELTLHDLELDQSFDKTCECQVAFV